MTIGRVLLSVAAIISSAALAPVLLFAAAIARLKNKNIDIGIGPQPLINNVYLKQALTLYGYSCETFVTHTFHVTEHFDVDFGRSRMTRSLPEPARRTLAALQAFWRTIFSYRCLYIYFNGGPLAPIPGPLGRLEPLLYRIAGVRIVVMPYGSDVQEMSRSANLLFKHAQSLSYPSARHRRRRIARNIDMWTSEADHVISGVEWVDYMHHWDTLMLGHFTIDTDHLQPPAGLPAQPLVKRPLRVLHAPNHRHIKGTAAILQALDDLRQEGCNIELELVEGRPNEEVLAAIERSDIVIDQLVVGWYAMFGLEAMALGKPVICYLRPDLLDFYRKTGLLGQAEPPLLSCDVLTIKSMLRDIAMDQMDLIETGRKSRAYAVRHHSLQAVGSVFDGINRSIGVMPGQQPPGSAKSPAIAGRA